jgi:IS5 family transposase
MVRTNRHPRHQTLETVLVSPKKARSWPRAISAASSSATRPTGERDAAKEIAADRPGAHQKTLGADKGYDTKGFVAEMRRIGVTPHVAQNTTRHEGYAKSINARRGIEKVFAWI